MEQLREDVTCSICLNVLNDPVSIECGHNFCRGCLSIHWSEVSAQGPHCPECRAPCSRDRMIPDIKSLVEKFTELFQEEPEPMAITFHNQRVMGSARIDYAVFLREKDDLSQHRIDCLTVDPSTMAQQFEEQRRSLLGRCREEMREPEETLLMALEVELNQEAETFLEIYRGRYRCYATNQRVMHRARIDYAVFLREKDDLSQHRIDCLTVDPSTMAQQFEEQRRSLLGRCREEMKEPEETLLTALEAELTWEAETFLETYRGRYRCHAISQTVMDRARTDHADFLREKGDLSQHMIDCLTVDPSTMAQQFEEQRRSLLGRCREELVELEKETLLTALEVEMTREAETFLKIYRRRYQCHAINQSVMDRARTDHTDFVREKGDLSQHMIDCLTVDPSTMAQQFEEQRRSLLGRCREELVELEKETLLMALEVEMTREAETFLKIYRRRYQCHAVNQSVMDRARTDHTDFLREKDRDSRNLIDCLKVRPRKMAKLFVERRGQLLWRCRMDIQEPAPDKETRLTELEEELMQEAETFLEIYRKRFKTFPILAVLYPWVLVGAPVAGAVGAGIGAGIAAAAVAAEAAVAIGAGTGAVAGIVVGGGVGGGVGGNITPKDTQRAKAAGGGREEGDGTEDLSDNEPRI